MVGQAAPVRQCESPGAVFTLSIPFPPSFFLLFAKVLPFEKALAGTNA